MKSETHKHIKSIYIFYTGGTIGCSGSPLVPVDTQKLHQLLLQQPGFTQNLLTYSTKQSSSLQKIQYTLDGFQQPLDSSNITTADWFSIAIKILENYEHYDGFVILHGTDTMAWTASALSYLLKGLSKPVIVTGSQIPLIDKGDALTNLLYSIVIAAETKITEVCIYFYGKLLRGNRTRKIRAKKLEAFDSPNFSPLGTSSIDTSKIDYHINSAIISPLSLAPNSLEKKKNQTTLLQDLRKRKADSQNISVIHIPMFPGIGNLNMIQHTVTASQASGVILQTFGTGNAPSNQEFLKELEALSQQGVIFVNITQTIEGSIDMSAYKTGVSLAKAGIIHGADLTPEAAFAKLTIGLSYQLSLKQIKEYIQTPIYGDLTPLSLSKL